MSNDALVLVVDDDEQLRSRLQRYLLSNGFRVSTADSAASARNSLRVLQPDLIVLDVTMPGETGLHLTEALREDRNDTPIPVQLGALLFDPARGELRGASGIIRLTAGEAALLGALANRPNETLTREDIARTLDMDEAGERAIDVQVTRLRRKIEADPREPRFLHTRRGRGYTLKPGL